VPLWETLGTLTIQQSISQSIRLTVTALTALMLFASRSMRTTLDEAQAAQGPVWKVLLKCSLTAMCVEFSLHACTYISNAAAQMCIALKLWCVGLLLYMTAAGKQEEKEKKLVISTLHIHVRKRMLA
jgi:hypothetical protein